MKYEDESYDHCDDCGVKIDYGNYITIGDKIYCGDKEHCKYHNDCKKNHTSIIYHVIHEYILSGHSFEILNSFTNKNSAEKYYEKVKDRWNIDASWETWYIKDSFLYN